MIKVSDIAQYLERISPIALQEDYDNAGLLVGNKEQEVSGVLCTLDITEEVIAEAIRKKCNMIVAHHPIIFRGLKKLTGKNYVEKCVIKAIKNDIALYAIHTNLDNVHVGVNKKIADKLQLNNTRILSVKNNNLLKLTFFVPMRDTEKVLNAVFEAGAGQIGEYKNCSFKLVGTGTFTPSDNANPHIGEANKHEEVQENRVEVILPKYAQNAVMNALRSNHPYEEVAYYLSELINDNQETGAGMVGNLAKPMKEAEFLDYLKDKMQLKAIKHTPLLDREISRVALCGGSGSFLLRDAISQKADIFITSDFKYHEFFDAENQIVIADIGHYESEFFTKELLVEFLNKKFTTFAILISETNTNPVNYFI